jgi:hypothetical protein
VAVAEVQQVVTENYPQLIVNYNTALASSLRTMDSLLASANSNPRAWATQLNTSQVALLYAQADLQQATPPPELLQLHTSLLAVATQCGDVIDRAAQSLAAQNLSALQQLREPLGTCRDGYNQATAIAQQLASGLAISPEMPASDQGAAPAVQAPATQPAAPVVQAEPILVNTPAPTATPVSQQLETSLPVVGQDVVVDEVRWKVLSAENAGSILPSGNQFIDDLTTSGTFVRVRFELENLSSDMLTFAGLDLVDGQNRSFTRSSNAFAFIAEGEGCVLENLNPNVTKVCTHVYELPANAAGLKAKLSDLKMFGTQEALVALGW